MLAIRPKLGASDSSGYSLATAFILVCLDFGAGIATTPALPASSIHPSATVVSTTTAVLLIT